jgi:hypothetical protein
MTVYFQLRMDLLNKMIMPRMTNLSIIDSNPILFDCRLAYGYYCCCLILTMSHPANEIFGGFWLILLRMFHFDVYHNSLPVFDQNRMNLVLNLYNLLIKTT